MGVKVQIDATLSTRLLTLPPGILLGTDNPPRLLAHHATPPTPPRVPPTRWAAEHAHLVLAMCPGGLTLCAAYNPTSISLATDLARALAAPIAVSLTGRRLIAKEVPEDVAVAPRSADLRAVAGLLLSAVRVLADVYLPPLTVRAGEAEDLAAAERACGTRAAALVERAAVRVEGAVAADIADTRPLAELLGWPAPPAGGKKKSGAMPPPPRAPVAAEVLLPAGLPASSLQDAQRTGERLVGLSGGMRVDALVMQDATLGDVVAAVRADVVRSLQSRMQLLREMDDAAGEEEEVTGEAGAGGRAVPVRVVACPVEGCGLLPMTEYLVEGEGIEEDVPSRFAEVLSWTDEVLEQYELVQVERFADVDAVAVEPLSGVDPSRMKALDAAASAPVSYVYHALIIAVVVAILAVAYKLVT